MSGAVGRRAAPSAVWPRLGIAPGPVLRVFGLRRSGNHAVINWLQRNAPGGRALFFNNCTPGRDPFETCRAVEIDGRRVAGAGVGDDPARLARLGRRAGDGAALILSYEDIMPAARRQRPLSKGIDDSLIDVEVIVARSFLNWAASLVRKLQANPDFSAHRRVAIVLRAVSVYAQMLGLMARDGDGAPVVIRYDDWASSPACRAAILARLGFAARDDSLGPVQSYGNGSSFADPAARGEQLRVRERWQQMADDPEYRIVLWLAAQDAALCEGLARSFPDDAERLGRLADAAADMMPPRDAQGAATAQILRSN
ncbi:MAG: hypothetical protein Kow0058_07130 [Roseovarius sp.]